MLKIINIVQDSGSLVGGRHMIGQKGTQVNEIIGGGFIGVHFTTVLVTQLCFFRLPNITR